MRDEIDPQDAGGRPSGRSASDRRLSSLGGDPARRRFRVERRRAGVRANVRLLVRALHPPMLALGAALALGLAWSGQARQVYLRLLEGEALDPVIAGAGLLAAALCSALLVAVHHQLSALTALRLRGEGRLSDPKPWIHGARLLASLSVGGAVWLGLIFGVAGAAEERFSAERLLAQAGLDGELEALQVAPEWLIFVLALIGAIVCVGTTAALRVPKLRAPTLSVVFAGGSAAAVFILIAPWLAPSAREAALNTIAAPSAGIDALGPIAAALLGVAALVTVIAAVFVFIARRVGDSAPVVLLALLAVYELSPWSPWTLLPAELRGLGRLTAQPVPTADAEPELATQLRLWADARLMADPQARGAAPYPIYVIASQGGGMYAAASSAAVLSLLQARCPHFAQHVFAISAVSGGAVGAALFNASLDDPEIIAGGRCGAISEAGIERARALRETTTADHITPVLFGLARDALFPVSAIWRSGRDDDRAARLEASLLRHSRPAWRARLAEDEASSWSPRHARPAIVFNLTSTDGERVVVAPFAGFLPEAPRAATLNQVIRDEAACRGATAALDAPRRLEAALASARFPWVLPSWRAPHRCVQSSGQSGPAGAARGGAWRDGPAFVDGGYVDASGALTGAALYEAIIDEVAAARRLLSAGGATQTTALIARLRPRLILLSDDFDARRAGGRTAPSDLSAPIRALISVRDLRAETAVAGVLIRAAQENAREEGGGEQSAGEATSATQGDVRVERAVSVLRFNFHNFDVPLAWALSRGSVDVILAQTRAPLLSVDAVGVDRDPAARAVRRSARRNACLLAEIVAELSPRAPQPTPTLCRTGGGGR